MRFIMYKELTVFLKNGSTLKFENVTDFSYSLYGESVRFYYVSMSTGKKKYATLFLDKIVMYSYEKEQ